MRLYRSSATLLIFLGITLLITTSSLSQSAGLKFLHKSGITLRHGGTPEISRWWNNRDCDPILSSPGGATDGPRSVAPPGLGGSTGLIPVVPPPANLHRASGAKTCVETLAAGNARKQASSGQGEL